MLNVQVTFGKVPAGFSGSRKGEISRSMSRIPTGKIISDMNIQAG